MKIGPFTHEEFMEEARRFHGYPAPGLIIGGYMVELARSHMPQGVLYDALSETTYCLPDAIQMLTPCTFGNGWLRVLNLGLYAMSLFDKRTGQGVRVHLDVDKLDAYPTIREWFMKTRPKREQDTDLLQEEIYEAGISILTAQPVALKPEYMERRSKGGIARCALCGEPHPVAFGTVCRSCQGQSPYATGPGLSYNRSQPRLVAVPVEEAVGKTALHDMTHIEPGVSKGPVIVAGQVIGGGDLCRLQLMGRNSVYLDDQKVSPDWMHENDVARGFGSLMPGAGVSPSETIKEGKINFLADTSGVLWIDVERLERFNTVPGVICATRHHGTVVSQGALVAASRAIPLYLPTADYLRAESVLSEGPLFSVLPFQRSKIGVLITGTEVFRGLIEDKFEPVIRQKAQSLGCDVVQVLKAPDDAGLIRQGVTDLLHSGAQVIITTAGLSVDPDDVTRQGLVEAGLEDDMLYGVPVLPGAMTLVGRVADAAVLGVPACALYHKTTTLDIVLPWLLAEAPLTRQTLTALGHGGLCHDCKTCTHPKCWFGK